jgi:hypothetical protein
MGLIWCVDYAVSRPNPAAKLAEAALKPGAVQQSLNRLAQHNLIYRVRYGEYAYTAPLFGDFLRRRHPRQDTDG